MAAWVVCALCALIIVKPQEFVPALAGLPLVYVAFAAAIAAAAVDTLRRRIRPAMAPPIRPALGFFAWGLLVTAVKRPDALGDEIVAFAILSGVFLALAICLASPRGLRAFAWMFLGCALLATMVAIVQAQRPLGCFLGAADDWEGKGELTFDGRPCETALDCRVAAPIPDGNYRCEHVGPLSTSSIGGRVRYRGSIGDPNELSLMISAAIPFALGLGSSPRRRARRRGLSPGRPALLPPLITDRLILRVLAALRAIPTAAAVTAIGYAVVLARSRSGLIAFLLVMGVWLVRRAGGWGIVAACVVAPPMLLFGGRSGSEADESSDERAELLREAFEMIRDTRGVGIGAGQFPDASSIGLTAHNAYVLAASESGIVGLYLFGLTLYLSLKVAFALWLGDYRLSRETLRFASALAVAESGAAVGVFFLSWTYKDVFYMLLGASAALYAVARAEDGRVRVRLSAREAALVGAVLLVLLGGAWIGSRLHGR